MIRETEINISIIMPLYNVEKFVEKCLESVKNQTFSAYELIIVNDCSTDNSALYVHKFMKDNPKIKCTFIQNNQNMGDNYSRNVGLQIAQGKYICFLDSDDTWHTEFLSLLYGEIQSQNADLVFCGYDRCFKTKVLPYDKTWQYPRYNSIFRLKLNYLLGKTHICHCTVLYHQSFLLQTGLQYTVGCQNAGDTEFITKILFNNPRFSCVPQSLYYYNIHVGSISTSYPSSQKFDGYFAYERAKEYIKNPFWKVLFVLTRESRKITHIIEEFYEYNLELPYLFCSKQKIMFLLFVNMILRRTKQSRNLLQYFYHTYIKKG